MKLLFLLMFMLAGLQASTSNTYISKNTPTQEITAESSFQNEDSMAGFDSEFEESDKENKEEIDPISGYNRAMTNFNDYFYIHILNPIAKAYKFIMPKPVRKGIANAFDNLLFPVRLTNNILQLKFKNSYLETQRFLINSTIGIAGLIDIANDNFNIKQHQEDFGQTLGYYGVENGFYIVWPLFGPSNIRDSVGFIIDSFINPMSYMQGRGYNLFDNSFESTMSKTGNIINYSSLHLGEYEKLKKDAINLYPFLKNIYEQRRKKQISE